MQGKTEAFAAQMATDLASPASALAGLGPRVDEVRETWRQALLAQLPDETPADKAAAAEEMLEAGRWLEGAKSIATLIAPQQNALRASNASAAAAAESPAFAAAITARRVPVRAAMIEGAAPLFRTPAEITAALHMKAQRTLGSARALQNLIVAVLLAIAAWGIFAETFIGTPANLLTVFFWAFGMDLSLSSLLTAAGRFKPPGPA